MSSEFELDLVTLHIDTNISHTIALANVTTSSNALEELLNLECCTLREIIFDSQLKTLDVTKFSIQTQLEFLTKLVSERFDSTCFTNANDTVYVKCFFSPDPGICISKWSVTPEEASSFKKETEKIPVDSTLPLACLLTDHQHVQTLMEHTSGKAVDTKKLLFYGISCTEIVNSILHVDETGVHAEDTRGRTPLFYALTSSLDSARKLLENKALINIKDECNVTVLTYFAENISKNLNLPVPIEDGLKLLSSYDMEREKMIKELLNLIFCKFIQVLGSVCVPSNSQDGYTQLRMLYGTLKWVLDQKDKRNALVDQLQSMQKIVVPTDQTICKAFDILGRLGAKPSQARDSEGNTCLHHAARLIFHGVPKETVTYICHHLIKMDPKVKLPDKKNHKEETPLLFCFSSTKVIANSKSNNWSGSLQAVCKVLVDKGSKLGFTTRKEESAFQLILKLLQYAIILPDKTDHKRCIFEEMEKILEMFSSKITQSKVAVNTRDIHLNSPLHLWASLALKSSCHYSTRIFHDQSFEEVLKHILDLLLKCGVQLNDSNEKGETPLHVCRTWTAVKLLLDAGANPSVTDSSGRTPLLAAAMNNTCLKKGSNNFYPDITEDPNEFWEDVLHRKLDPWTSDKKGESVLSALIDKEVNDLSTALIECACNQMMQIDTIGIPLLVTICKDKSIDKDWKFDLVKKLLDTKRSLVHGRLRSNKDTALHFCCRSILELPEDAVQSSVQWKIIEYLLKCGADVTTAGESGESCEDLSHHCPPLRSLLSTPVDYSQLPIVLNHWKESSVEHKKQLSLVARMVKYQEVECKGDESPLYLFNEPLDADRGSFGLAFVGIAHHDVTEVAVKRIVKANVPNGSGVESVLVSTARCKKIVSYMFCKDVQNFYYVAYDLMEGNLEDYLDRTRASRSKDTTKLCNDVLMGLHFLQCQGVVHGNINPRTVFYQSQAGGVCLKIGNCVARSHRRGWIASEVLSQRSSPPVFSHQSDMFSCGLALHYLLSDKKHPFAPVDCTTKTPEEILLEKEENIKKGHIVRLDDSLSPEATHLVQLMLDSDPSSRPSAAEALAHPFFWNMKTKKYFLHFVGNEPEIGRQGRYYPLTAFESDLEEKFSTIVTRGSKWKDSAQYDKISATEARMRVKPKNGYNYSTIAGLVRFIRNAYEHINEQPVDIQKMWTTDFVLNDYFPKLIIEVYKVLTTSKLHQLHKTREEIKKFFCELEGKIKAEMESLGVY